MEIGALIVAAVAGFAVGAIFGTLATVFVLTLVGLAASRSPK